MKKSKDNEIKSLKKIIRELKKKIKKLEQGETFWVSENKKLNKMCEECPYKIHLGCDDEN